MKKPILLLFLSAFVFSFSKGAHSPASVAVQQNAEVSHHECVMVKVPSKNKRFRTKLEKRIQKWKKRLALPNGSTSLNICLVLLGMTILLFALRSEVSFLSLLASFTAIGAAVFFMFWLLSLNR